MKTDIPYVKFESGDGDKDGFEVVSIEKIYQNRKTYDVNPETPHQLKFYNLIFFTEGESQHLIDFKWYPVKKNSLIFLTKEQVNAFKFTENLKGVCLIFTEDYFVKCMSSLPKNVVFRLFLPELFSPILEIPKNSDFEKYLNLLKSESYNNNSFNQDIIIESLFVILLSKAEELKQSQTLHINDSSRIGLFQKFKVLLSDNYTHNRSAEFYAKQLSITYKHLNVLCKELVAKTAKSIIDDYIILQAKRNLINSDIKSTELGYKLGFSDPTNFTKYFKKKTGVTPNLFKKNYK